MPALPLRKLKPYELALWLHTKAIFCLSSPTLRGLMLCNYTMHSKFDQTPLLGGHLTWKFAKTVSQEKICISGESEICLQWLASASSSRNTLACIHEWSISIAIGQRESNGLRILQSSANSPRAYLIRHARLPCWPIAILPGHWGEQQWNKV